MLKEVIGNFISVNYVSLILILVIMVFVYMNKDEKPEGIQWIVLILGLVLILIFLNFVENYADGILGSGKIDYNLAEARKITRFIYFKTFMEYSIYNGVLLLEILLMTSYRGKRLMLLCIPELLVVIVSGISAFGIPLAFQYDEMGKWQGDTPFHFIPYVSAFFYLLVLSVYSLRILNKKSDRKMGAGILLVVIITIVTGFLENYGILTGFMDEIVMVDILVYYYYFYSVYRERIKEELFEKKLEMEKSKTTLMMAQIKPHFIFNCLAIIRYLCGEDKEMAMETIDHFSDYLRQSMNILAEAKCIPFKEEKRMVENYFYMEKVRFGDKVIIEENITTDSFMIPPLTLQPLVENAINHGIRRKREPGTVIISTWEEEREFIVCVEDDGVGFEMETWNRQGEHRNHVGLQNVKLRLELMAEGRLEMKSEPGKGTKVIMKLPKKN